MQPKLKLDISDTLSACTMVIYDISEYPIGFPISCPRLEVTVPGFKYPVVFENISGGFTKVLNACNLNLQTTGCDVVSNDLPDGLYVIKYSINPNDTLYVEYNYLRINKLLNRYKDLLCCIESKAEDNKNVHMDMYKDLSELRYSIDAAKAAAEWCHDANRGLKLYDKANKLITRYFCRYCGRC